MWREDDTTPPFSYPVTDPHFSKRRKLQIIYDLIIISAEYWNRFLRWSRRVTRDHSCVLLDKTLFLRFWKKELHVGKFKAPCTYLFIYLSYKKDCRYRNKTTGNESLLEVERNCSLVFVHRKTITCIKRLLRARLENFLRLNCNMWT